MRAAGPLLGVAAALTLWAATPVIAPAAFFVRQVVRRPQPQTTDEPTPQEADAASAVEAAVMLLKAS